MQEGSRVTGKSYSCWCLSFAWYSSKLLLFWGVFEQVSIYLKGSVWPVTFAFRDCNRGAIRCSNPDKKNDHCRHCQCSRFHHRGTSANPNSLAGTSAVSASLWLPEGNLVSQALKWSSLAALQDISSPPWRESNITEALACFLSSPRRRRKLPAVEHSTLHLRMMEEKERRKEQSGGLHSQLHCVRRSHCAICVTAWEMTTLLARRMTVSWGPLWLMCTPQRWEKRWQIAAPALVNLQPISSTRLPK